MSDDDSIAKAPFSPAPSQMGSTLPAYSREDGAGPSSFPNHYVNDPIRQSWKKHYKPSVNGYDYNDSVDIYGRDNNMYGREEPQYSHVDSAPYRNDGYEASGEPYNDDRMIDRQIDDRRSDRHLDNRHLSDRHMDDRRSDRHLDDRRSDRHLDDRRPDRHLNDRHLIDRQGDDRHMDIHHMEDRRPNRQLDYPNDRQPQENMHMNDVYNNGSDTNYVMNSGHLVMENMAGSRAPLPGFTSFV